MEQAAEHPVGQAEASTPDPSIKTFVHIVLLSLALGAAGLLTGCASHRTTASAPRRSTDFEVVETSSKRMLTSQEMLQLKSAVARYLEKEGAVASGDYYVKVYLGPDKDGVPADWVIVRFSRDSNMRFSLLASYPYYYDRSYAAYDYYPYGYDHFGRISFQYYNDPYYGNHYYFPPRHDRDRNHDGKHDRGKDRDRDGDRGDHGRADTPRFKPIPAVGTQQTPRPRRDNNSSDRNSQPRESSYPRHGSGPAQERQSQSRQDTASSAPVRSEPVRSESTRTYSAPAARSESSYTSSVSRSESSSSSSSNQSQREANESAAQRERLE